MLSLPLFRSISLFLGALVLAGCGAAPWDDEIDVTQLLRLSPNDFRVVSVIPPGLGERGSAQFQWVILKPEGGIEFSEVFEMQRDGKARLNGQGHLEVAYKLGSKDRARFQTQQIRQRAQLLAGFYHIGLNVVPDLCDRAGVAAGSSVVYSVLIDTGAETKITTVRIEKTAADLERTVPYCV